MTYTNVLNTTFTPSSNCAYIRFRPLSTYGTTYNNDICINLSWDGERDGEYEPYVKHEYALDSSLTLRGVPKLDANNRLYYDGDEYANDGTVTRKYAVIDLGTCDWNYDSTYAFFYTTVINDIKLFPTNNTYPNWICESKYAVVKVKNSNSGLGSYATGAITGRTDARRIYVKDTAYTDATTFKTSVNGIHLLYEVATSTTESADAFTSPQIIDDFGTEEFVVTEQSGVAMPVGHISRYTNNLRAKLEMAPESPNGGNGKYVVQQTSGINTYVPLVIDSVLPSAPSADGTYVLKVTVSGGTESYSWVQE